MIDLREQGALVTGGSRGIGRAAALLLATGHLGGERWGLAAPVYRLPFTVHAFLSAWQR